MSFTALNRYRLILLVTVLAAWPGVAPAGEREPTAVVARLYKDFAWQAITASEGQSVGAKSVFGKNLAWQSNTDLRKYFSPALADLLVRDARCVITFHGPCNLDFDPVFASQDPAAADLQIRSMDGGRVKVEYKHPSSGEHVKLEFSGSVVGGNWRITDIVYKNLNGVSLRELLMRTVSD